jgi:hypothetical protein
MHRRASSGAVTGGQRRRPPGVGVLRDAARSAVERTSLRSVARAIGMSAPGLALFLDGGTPNQTTLSKIRLWYFSEAAVESGVSEDVACVAIGVLLEPLPAGARPRVHGEMLALLAEAYRRQGTLLPSWLDALLAGSGPWTRAELTRSDADGSFRRRPPAEPGRGDPRSLTAGAGACPTVDRAPCEPTPPRGS